MPGLASNRPCEGNLTGFGMTNCNTNRIRMTSTGMALSKDTSGARLSAQLIALAKEQAAAVKSENQCRINPASADKVVADTFSDLLDSVDIDHRLPLLDASTLARYRALLQARWALVSPWLDAAMALPTLSDELSPPRNTASHAGRMLGSNLHHHCLNLTRRN